PAGADQRCDVGRDVGREPLASSVQRALWKLAALPGQEAMRCGDPERVTLHGGAAGHGSCKATLSGSPDLALEDPQPEMPAILGPSAALRRHVYLIGLEHDRLAGVSDRDVERKVVGQHPIEDNPAARLDDEA